jgi:hypothetical protein
MRNADTTARRGRRLALRILMTATLAIGVAAGPATMASADGACHRVQHLSFSEPARSVLGMNGRICADGNDIPGTVKITRNGQLVASGKGEAVYNCHGYGQEPAVFRLLYTTAPPVTAYCV